MELPLPLCKKKPTIKRGVSVKMALSSLFNTEPRCGVQTSRSSQQTTASRAAFGKNLDDSVPR